MNEVLQRYLIGKIRAVAKIPTGLIHETYKVEAGEGTFILQKQHAIFEKEVVEDVDAVSKHLVKKGLTAQTLVKTKDGVLFVEHKGGVWRLLTFIPGEVFEAIPNASIAYEAGGMLGRFHRGLENFEYKFKHTRLLHHNTREHIRLLQKVATIRESCELEADILFVLETLPRLLLPEALRKTTTQGDPKITNVIFQNQKAVALIDVDDVGRSHNVLIELGDAFRSWCGKQEGTVGNTFDIALFRAGLRGYDEGSCAFLLPEERALISQAIKLVTLELASRFLRDCIEDNYFGWDSARYPSRKAHNLARARGQIALYRDIVDKEQGILATCS